MLNRGRNDIIKTKSRNIYFSDYNQTIESIQKQNHQFVLTTRHLTYIPTNPRSICKNSSTKTNSMKHKPPNRFGFKVVTKITRAVPSDALNFSQNSEAALSQRHTFSTGWLKKLMLKVNPGR